MKRENAGGLLIFLTLLFFMITPTLIVTSVFALDVSRYATHAETLHRSNITGSGVTVAVIDTGIDFNHSGLSRCH